MRAGRPKTPLVLTKEEYEQLKSMVKFRSLLYHLVNRVRIVLMAAEGEPDLAIAKEVGLSGQMVCKWRQLYLQQGLSGLHDELRPGRPRSISHEKVAILIRKTLQPKLKHGTHWTIRSMSEGAVKAGHWPRMPR